MNAALFQRILQEPATLQDVPLSEVETLVDDYPWMGTAHVLLALKKRDMNAGDAPNALRKAAIYFNNPLWLHFQLERFEQQPEVVIEEPRHAPVAAAAAEAAAMLKDGPVSTAQESDATTEPVASTEEAPLFEPLFAVDYFASQGIRLKEDGLGDDQLSQQVKSFTQWLKSMKKIYVEAEKPMDVKEEKEVIAKAADSNQQAEVITEAMAEVLVKQHKTKQAIELYRKLSLLHPEKSHYFASRIEILNQSK